MVFPYDFGFIPSTLAQDGDPIDVLIFMDTSVPMGCTLFCRLIGVIEAEQKHSDSSWEENDRLIAVARDARIHEAIKHVDDVPQQSLKEMEQFFVEYNKMHGKTFRFLGVGGPKKAAKRLAAAIDAYKKSSARF